MTKKIWKYQICAERAWMLAALLATNAGSLAGRGKGLAIVAEEARRLSRKMHTIVEEVEFADKPEDMFDHELADAVKQLGLLAQNGCIEMIRVNGYHDLKDTITAAICLEDIRSLAYDMQKLICDGTAHHLPVLEASNPITTTESRQHFLQFTIGGIRIIESVRYVREIIEIYKPEDGHICVRGHKIPVINLFEKIGLQGKLENCIIINIDWKEKERLYAIPVDAGAIGNIDVFYSRIGRTAEVRNSRIPVEYIRECWDANEDEQMIFLDWCKLAK